MELIQGIKERRSIRKFKNEVVDRGIMTEIVDIARFAPSWSNFQVARWTLVDNPEVIAKLASQAVRGFVYNKDVLTEAKGVAVLSHVAGVSGSLEQYGIDYTDTDKWETFDAGIACQTFCLAAHAKGVATCIFGLIDEAVVADIAEIPYGEVVSAMIVYGYGDIKPVAPKRKEINEVLRFL